MDLHIYDNDIQKKQFKNQIFISWNGEKINKYLELNKKEIRSKYTQVISKITNYNSKNHGYFKIQDIDLTKMSLINEKNPFKSDAIFDCLKLLVIEHLIENKKVKNIFYNGNISKINNSLKILCKNKNLNYQNRKFFFHDFFNNKIFFLLKGILFFFIQVIKNFGLKENSKKYSDISIFSYFVHFNSTKSKIFKSNLWGDLPKFLNLKKIPVNWFHFFVASNQIKNSKKANNLRNKFNLNNYENHNFINSFLSNEDLLRSISHYFYFFIKNIFSKKISLFFFSNKISKTNFYYFLEKDLFSSYFGPTLIYNIMNIYAINRLLEKIPRQKIGIFIIENQSWEYCFIKLWKKYNHGKLFAYFNSSIRFWDLRYIKNKNEFKIQDENPDQFLINSKIFKSEAKKNGYPSKKIKLVEALRYNKLKPVLKIKQNKKILIIGDILFSETDKILFFLSNVKKNLKNYSFYLKPHPTMTLKSINIFKQKYSFIKIVSNNSENFKNFEFVICSNGTSAILDCITQNLNFCSIKPLNSLNLYPIEKYQSVYQVKTHKDLIFRIKYKKKLKKIKIFETRKNLDRFLRIFVNSRKRN